MSTINEPLHVASRLSCDKFNCPDESISDDAIDPARPLGVDKMYHRVHPHAQSGNAATAVIDETKFLYHAYQEGTVVSVKVGVIVAAIGDSTCTVDVKKNGTTILSAIITLDNSDTAYTFQSAGLVADPTYDEDDVFEVTFDATVGTGTLPKGVYVQMVAVEAPIGGL